MNKSQIIREFSEGIRFFAHAFADVDLFANGKHFDLKLSLGRTLLIVWFIETIKLFSIMVTAPMGLLVFWFLFGFTLLGYTIGTKYLILSFKQTPQNLPPGGQQ